MTMTEIAAKLGKITTESGSMLILLMTVVGLGCVKTSIVSCFKHRAPTFSCKMLI